MKRSWLITILVCLLLLGGGTVVILMPQVVPYSQCSDVYKQYADVDGIDATFIKGYRVNDTLTVNVTLLQATDSAGWARLQRDFGAHGPTDTQREALEQGKDIISFKLFRKDNSPAPIDKEAVNNVVAVSYLKHAVCVYHTETHEQVDRILEYQIKYSISQYKKQQY